MASVAYDIGQGERKTISNPMRTAAVGGDNPTPFYLNFPYLPPGMQWVFPYTYNFMYPVESPTNLLVDASKIPTGFPPAPTSTSKALLHAYDTQQPYSAGTRTAASSPTTQSTVAGTLTTTGDTLNIACGGATAIAVKLGGAIDATSQLAIEGTVDDTSWDFLPTLINAVQANSRVFWVNNPTLVQVIIGTATQFWVACAGLSQIRVRLFASGTGPIKLVMRATPGALLPTPVNQQFSIYSQPVVIASDQPAFPVTVAGATSSVLPTEATSLALKSAQFNVQFAANGTLDLVAAVAGQRVYCIELNIESNAAVVAAVTLQDDVPNILSTIRTDNIGFKGGRALHGVSGALGHKVQLKNGAAVLPTVAGELIYVQQ